MPVPAGHTYKFFSRISTSNVSFDGIAGVYNNSDTPVRISSIKGMFSGLPAGGYPTDLIPLINSVANNYMGVFGVAPISDISNLIVSRPLELFDSNASTTGITCFEDAKVLNATSTYNFILRTGVYNNANLFLLGTPSIYTIGESYTGEIYAAKNSNLNLIINEGECFYIEPSYYSTAKSFRIAVTFTDITTGNTFITRSSELAGMPGASELVILNAVGSGKTLRVDNIINIIANTTPRVNTSSTAVALGYYRLVRGRVDTTFDTAEYKFPVMKYDSNSPDINLYGFTGPFNEAKLMNPLNLLGSSTSVFITPSDFSYALTTGFIKNLYMRGAYSSSGVHVNNWGQAEELLPNEGLVLNPNELVLVSVNGISPISNPISSEYIENVYTMEFEMVTIDGTPTSSGISAPTYGWL